MMTRGERKRLLREACRQRIQAEREAIEARFKPHRWHGAMSETQAIEFLKEVPTIFAFAEKLDSRYTRPQWADHQYGAR